MTSIVIPVSTPGAGESADALTRAAVAATALARGLDQERLAAVAVTQARKSATDAAKAMAQGDRERIASVKATTQALKEEAVQARQLADYETRDIIAQRAKLANPHSGGGGGGGHQGGGYAGAVRRHSGMVSGALSGGLPDVGAVASGIIQGGATARIAIAAGVIGAAAFATFKAVELLIDDRKALIEAERNNAKGIADAIKGAGGVGIGALGGNGKALIAATAANPSAMSAAQDIVKNNPGVSVSAALGFVKSGLSDKQIKAATMAATISGGDPAAYGEKLRSMHVDMGTPQDSASFLLSTEGIFKTPALVKSSYAQGQAAAGAYNNVTRDGASTDFNNLGKGMQGMATVESRRKRMMDSLGRNPALQQRYNAIRGAQSDRDGKNDTMEATGDIPLIGHFAALRVFLDEIKMKNMDNANKIVVGNGNSR